MAQQGKFIVLEGIDGSSKTTQMNELVKRLSKTDIPFHRTFECTNGPVGKLLRNIYLTGERKADERIINVLYQADRLDHITNQDDGMLKFLNEGINVICDRYYLSSIAYDSYSAVSIDKNGKLEPTNRFIRAVDDILGRNAVNIELLRPTITIYIDTPPEVALERISKNREEATVYEKLDKLQKIYLAYDFAMKKIQRESNEIFYRVDGNRTISEIADEIWKVVYGVLGR